MPSTSKKQSRFMTANCKSEKFRRKTGMSKKVACDFHRADKGKYHEEETMSDDALNEKIKLQHALKTENGDDTEFRSEDIGRMKRLAGINKKLDDDKEAGNVDFNGIFTGVANGDIEVSEGAYTFLNSLNEGKGCDNPDCKCEDCDGNCKCEVKEAEEAEESEELDEYAKDVKEPEDGWKGFKSKSDDDDDDEDDDEDDTNESAELNRLRELAGVMPEAEAYKSPYADFSEEDAQGWADSLIITLKTGLQKGFSDSYNDAEEWIFDIFAGDLPYDASGNAQDMIIRILLAHPDMENINTILKTKHGYDLVAMLSENLDLQDEEGYTESSDLSRIRELSGLPQVQVNEYPGPEETSDEEHDHKLNTAIEMYDGGNDIYDIGSYLNIEPEEAEELLKYAGRIDYEPDEYRDGDHESALASAGFGTDEDYGHFGDYEESEMFPKDSMSRHMIEMIHDEMKKGKTSEEISEELSFHSGDVDYIVEFIQGRIAKTNK